MRRRERAAAIGAVLTAFIWHPAAQAALTFTITGTWDTDTRKAAATAAMQAVVDRYNAYGNFTLNNDGNIEVDYNSGVPTAQSNYNGTIDFGGTYPNERVAQHESNHWLGSGTTTAWTNKFTNNLWTGAKMNALAAQFDGDGTVINQSGVHFYPYGLNFDSEVVNSSVLMRNIALEYAQRQDDGLGTQTDPWTAKAVVLKQSDAVGTSAFNYFGMWSDNYFVHPNADYYSGNYVIRTPLDTYTPTAATPSFTFAGDSLTLNNRGDPTVGLFFKGVGNTSVLTFKNLILDGGSIHHFSGVNDLFQLAGKLSVISASTITPEQGNINILSNLIGTGTLTIGKTTINDGVNGVVRVMSSANTYTGNIIVGSGALFELSNGANQKFIVRAAGNSNSISGSAAHSVLLDGNFQFDLTNASANPGDFWSIVSTSATTYGAEFTVSGFSEPVAGLWTNGQYYFSQTTGHLTFGSDGSFIVIPAVPEPASIGWLSIAAATLLRRRSTR